MYRRSFITTLPFLALAMWPVGVGAQPAFDYSVKKKVHKGREQPSLTLKVGTPLTRVNLVLTRDDGEKVVRQVGAVPAGQEVIFTWSQNPGKQHYEGELSLFTGPNEEFGMPLDFSVVVGIPPTITIVPGSVDIEGRKLQVTLDQPAGTAELVIIGEGGAELSRERLGWSGQVAKTPLDVTWPVVEGTPLRLDLTASSADGFPGKLLIYPWNYRIPHEDVEFESGQSVIRPGEEVKLERSLEEINKALRRFGDVVEVSLFVAGYTDTVDSAEYNDTLSRQRAQAIARWFRGHGYQRPVFYQGFGERVLAAPTPDNTAEPRNRRAVYVLAADAPTGKDFPANRWLALK